MRLSDAQRAAPRVQTKDIKVGDELVCVEKPGAYTSLPTELGEMVTVSEAGRHSTRSSVKCR